MDSKITKADFIELLCERCSTVKQPLNRTYASMIYDTFIDIIQENLIEGKRVYLKNIGTFELKTHKGHTSIQGEQLPDYTYVAFTAAENLKKNIKGKANEQ